MNVSSPCENVERTQFSRGLGRGMKEPGFISPTTIPHTTWLTSFSQPSWDDSQLMDAGADTDWGQAQGPVGHGEAWLAPESRTSEYKAASRPATQLGQKTPQGKRHHIPRPEARNV